MMGKGGENGSNNKSHSLKHRAIQRVPFFWNDVCTSVSSSHGKSKDLFFLFSNPPTGAATSLAGGCSRINQQAKPSI